MELPKKGEKVTLLDLVNICMLYGRDELSARILAEPPAKPFVSDGCSSWPDEWHGIDFYEDCFLHDIEYWCGGSDAERFIADLKLAMGIAQKGAPKMAEIMLAGVRAGGHEFLPTPWRWGFGR